MERAQYTLDTHILIWIYKEQFSKFSKKLFDIIEESDLYISPIVELELQYLYEIGRLKDSPQKIIFDLQKFLEIEILETSFSDIIFEAKKILWTRDAFDRIIIATSMVEKMKLLTADQKIIKNSSLAEWK
jgi:PIN domain nuclease of toxin-antitoxin system